MNQTNNLRVSQLQALSAPAALLSELPITATIIQLVTQTRHDIQNILHGRDNRLLVIVGPCSIHDPIAGLEYAKRLKKRIDSDSNELCIVMRVYFEKPRTQIGWKGLINDPDLNNTFFINKGIETARHLLLAINNEGVPTGTEFLDTMIPQYISDLESWSAIGARTTESQIHRELASGLSMPLGFKNGTTGNVQIAVDAVMAARYPHHFLGIAQTGKAAIVSTTGNSDCHVILRGSTNATNYDPQSIAETVARLQQIHLPARVMVDCSHGNSQKDYKQQMPVVHSLCKQISDGNQHIFGVILESNLLAGKQDLTDNQILTYGQSITDACICWEETEIALNKLTQAVKNRKQK